MIENREIKKFYKEVQEEIKSSMISEEDGASPEQLFTEYSLAILAENGETENYRVSYDEKINKRGTVHKINGYALYENYETLDLFITIYYHESEIQQVPKPDADKAIDKLIKFFRNAIYKDYLNEIEESSEIFDLAQTLSNVKEVKEFLTRINIFLITNGEVKADLPTSNKVAGYPVFYRVFDINYLFNLSQESGIPIEIDFKDYNSDIPCIVNENKNNDYQSYLATIPGSILADIYEQYGPRLLEQNVRSFLQFTGKINKGIRKTILEEPHMFLAFNNGIAATAENIELRDLPNKSGKAISAVKDFQIVNGGQTTASIYHTWKKNKADISRIFVQLKLTIIKDKDNFADIVGRIAEYANTQNKVSASDLSSNKENHVILEKISRTIWAPPKKGEMHQTRWFFERSRGQYRNEKTRFGITPARRKQFEKQNPRKQMFTKELMAKYVNTYKEVYKGNKLVIGPHIVVRGSQKNYSQFLNYNFTKKPDNIFFEDTIALALIFKSAEKIYGVKPNAIGDMRYITVPYTIAYIGYKLEYSINLYSIWQNQGIPEYFRDLIHDTMIKVENFIKNNAPGSLYGEWAKKEECWQMLKNHSIDLSFDCLPPAFFLTKESEDRVTISDTEIDSKLKNSEIQLIHSIPIDKWKEIYKLSTGRAEISQHLKDRSLNIMSTLKLKKDLSVKQRTDALKIIDIILTKTPDFFDQLGSSEKTSNKQEVDISNINPEFISKMVEWDTKAKVLTPNELQYIADFAYGLKKLNDFHKKNISRHLIRLREVGFNE
ncbi:MAG: AIPR family protein [bacterium]